MGWFCAKFDSYSCTDNAVYNHLTWTWDDWMEVHFSLAMGMHNVGNREMGATLT